MRIKTKKIQRCTKNRRPKRKMKTSEEMGIGDRRMARNNNNTGRKIGGGPFAVP